MRYFFAIILFVVPLAGITQKLNNTGVISGKLIDSVSQKPMPLATVAVFSAMDTILITYRMSNAEGVFNIPSLPLNKKLRLLITYSGYAVFRQEMELMNDHPQMAVGAIKMTRNVQSLDEVLVMAERPPVIVKKDTIEFNASAFKTLPTALVEDLLRKLPGVNVDLNGDISVNGKKVSRLLVDGKDFFNGDVRLATRNLPANIIDKVQVTNDEEELLADPDKAKASVSQVINLKLKKAVKRGWFGKAYAGMGTDNRYEAGSIINLFKDTLQVSVLGFINNINRPAFGFNDVKTLGGFGRSGITSVSNSNGGLAVNGISFGGTTEGIQETGGIGFNMNNVLKKGAVLNSQYFYGQLENNINEISHQEQFVEDARIISRINRKEKLSTNNHRVSFGLKMKLNPHMKLDFRPSVTINTQKAHRVTNTGTVSNSIGPLNTSNNNEERKAISHAYNHTLSIAGSFKKPGRSISLYQTMYYNDADMDQVNDTREIFINDTSSLAQLRNKVVGNIILNNSVIYSRHLDEAFTLKLGYTFNFSGSKDHPSTFNRNPANGKYELPNAALTNRIQRHSFQNSFSTSIVWNYKELYVTGSVNLLKLDMLTRYNMPYGKNNSHYNYMLPGLAIEWKDLSMEYSSLVIPPRLADIQVVPDNTNPLYIKRGNAALKPARSHNLYLNFYRNIPQRTLTISAYMNGSIDENGIIHGKIIKANGVQEVFPVNANGVRQLFTQLSLSKQYKLQNKLQLSATAGFYANYFKHLIIINDSKTEAKIYEVSPYVRANFNWNDKIESNISYSRVIYKTAYEDDAFVGLSTIRQAINGEIIIRWPKKIIWGSTLDYITNSDAAPGLRKNILLLGGNIILLCMKEEKGQLKLAVYDALQQNATITRITTENYFLDRQINVLQRYFMLTFTYNIRSFKPNKVGGRQSLFLF